MITDVRIDTEGSLYKVVVTEFVTGEVCYAELQIIGKEATFPMVTSQGSVRQERVVAQTDDWEEAKKLAAFYDGQRGEGPGGPPLATNQA